MEALVSTAEQEGNSQMVRERTSSSICRDSTKHSRQHLFGSRGWTNPCTFSVLCLDVPACNSSEIVNVPFLEIQVVSVQADCPPFKCFDDPAANPECGVPVLCGLIPGYEVACPATCDFDCSTLFPPEVPPPPSFDPPPPPPSLNTGDISLS